MARVFTTHEPTLDPRHDELCIRVGTLRLVANLKYPPLTRNYQIAWIAIYVFLMFVAATAFAFAQFLLWRARWIVVIVGALTMGHVAYWPAYALWRFAGRPRDRKHRQALLSLHDGGSRPPIVDVRGRMIELLEFARLTRSSFEPLIFRTRQHHIAMTPERRVGGLIAIWAAVALILFYGLWLRWWWILPLAVICGLVLTLGKPRRPSYYRVIPGRLDWLKFRTDGRSCARSETFRLARDQCDDRPDRHRQIHHDRRPLRSP